MKSRFAIAGILLLLPGFALADPEGPEWKDCGIDKPPKVAIPGCTRALKASRSNDDKAVAYDFRAVAYRAAKKYKEALADMNEVVKLRNRAGSYHSRALIHRDLKQYDAAIADHDQAIRMEDDGIGYVIQRGITHEAAGNTDKAIADFEKALTMKPVPAAASDINARLARLRAKKAA